MATYTWQCKDCEAIVQVKRPMDDYRVPPSKACGCGSNNYTKLIDTPGISLVYGGSVPFYKEEYDSIGRREDYRPPKKKG